MPWLLRSAILGFALSVVLQGDSAADAGANVIPVAHFALIDPKADLANDQREPAADALALSRPRKSTTSLLLRSKSPAAVVPLKRNRPKRETDPPKTRRRQLGW